MERLLSRKHQLTHQERDYFDLHSIKPVLLDLAIAAAMSVCLLAIATLILR